jgi:hypothetical protein
VKLDNGCTKHVSKASNGLPVSKLEETFSTGHPKLWGGMPGPSSGHSLNLHPR